MLASPAQSIDLSEMLNKNVPRIRTDVQAGIIPGSGGCPILQNTPCVHVTPAMRAATGDR